MPRSRHGRWFGCLLAVAAMAGCADLPTSGSVHLGRSLPGVSGSDTESVRAFPSGPLPGQTPVGIVTGFLDALIDADNNYGVARLFLAPGTTWNSTGTTVYDQSSESVTRIGDHVVVGLTRVGRIDAHAHYRPAPGRINATFRLVRRDSRWRIAGLPSGVLLSTSDAQRSLQPTQLYYLNTAQTRLVPEPILVPVDQPGIATTLVSELLNRPPRSLSPAAVSAAPQGLDLIGNVPIGADGIAEVNLSGGTQRVSPVGLQRLSAQIVWTLRFIPGVRGVRLLDNGTPLSEIGPARFQSNATWKRFDPNAAPAARGVLLSRHGIVSGIGRAVPRGLAGARIYAPGTTADGSEVAALRRTARGARLLMGSATARVRPRLSGPAISAPAFAPTGDVFVVSGNGPGAVVVAVPPRGPIHQVTLPAALSAHGVVQLAISRDGARVAIVAGPRGRRSLSIGVLSMSGSTPSVTGVVTVVPASRDVSGAAWSSATTVVTTVRAGGGRRAVMRTSLDGYRPHLLSRSGLPRAPFQVAAAPGEPVLATASGGVWSLSGQSWHQVSTGRDPSYAG